MDISQMTPMQMQQFSPQMPLSPKRVSIAFPAPVNANALRPIAPQMIPTGFVPNGSIRPPDMRRISPRIDSGVSIVTQDSIDSDEDEKKNVKVGAKTRHTRLFTDKHGKVVDVAVEERDNNLTCPECHGECCHSGVSKSACWAIWIAFGLLVAGGLAGGLSYYFLSLRTSPGQPCTISAKCVDNSICSNSLCTCTPTYYVSGSTCKSRTLVGSSCTTAAECVANSFCNSTCQCLPAYYYDTSLGYCNTKVAYNGYCSYDSQCLTTSSQCLTTTTGKCGCISTMYYEGSTDTCYTLKVQGQSCSDVSQCIANSYCTSTVGGQCSCLSGYYYLNGVCASRITVGYACNSTSYCIANAACSTLPGAAYATCSCSTGYYADTYTGTCLANIAIGSSCSYNSQCISNAECVISYGMSFKQCACISYYYQENTPIVCVASKFITNGCYADKQCIPYASCYVISPAVAATCNCNSGFWFNASSIAGGYGACLVLGLPGSTCWSASQCISNSQCTTPSGSSVPRCDCATNYYFSYSTSTCVYRQSTGTSCIYDQQCLSNVCNVATTSLCS